jgi:MOSC domain-containing protein
MGARVSGLATTAVKSTRLATVERIELDRSGARGNRAFCVVDEQGRMINAKRQGSLQTVCASQQDGRLELTFPDGSRAAGPLEYGGTLAIKFFSHACDAKLLVGPWSQALSDYIGEPLRVVQPEIGVDRGRTGGVSVISRASIAHLAEVAAEDSVDPRRFRMLIEVDGVAPHEEDSWVRRKVRIGPALVMMHGNVGRCLVTGLDPETGVPTLPTLDLLGSYRRELETTEPLPFGIYGEVLEPGPVAVGDAVAVEG